VNLENASDKTGAALRIPPSHGRRVIPQRSNMTVTAGFSLPGFEARLRAFRTYKPVVDLTKPTGWKFVSDGTPLWPDLDGRPSLAGLARTPANSNARNIYTYIPTVAAGPGGRFPVANVARSCRTLAA
jgi:hypothetical protein